MKKVQFSLICSILVVLVVAQSFTERNHPLPLTQPFNAKNHVNKKAKSLTDFDVVINNHFTGDVDVWVFNNDTSYYLNVHPSQTGATITVPSGSYGITLWPNDIHNGYHYYQVGCNQLGGDYGSYTFWNSPISDGCNTVEIDY